MRRGRHIGGDRLPQAGKMIEWHGALQPLRLEETVATEIERAAATQKRTRLKTFPGLQESAATTNFTPYQSRPCGRTTSPS